MSYFEFPHTRTYDSDLGWLIEKMKDVLDNVDAQNAAIAMYKAWTEEHIAAVEQVAADLTEFVNTYFDNLDVQEEINNKIAAMAQDGSLLALIQPDIIDAVEDWLSSSLTPTSPPVDSTLSISGAAADAKVTGDNITELKNDITVSLTHLLSNPDEWEQGVLSPQTSYTNRVRLIESTTRIVTKSRTDVRSTDQVVFICPRGFKYRALFSAVSGALNMNSSYTVVLTEYDDINTWYTEDRTIPVPNGAVSFMVNLAKEDDSIITADDLPGGFVYIKTIGAAVAKIEIELNAIETGYEKTDIDVNWRSGNYGPNGNGIVSSDTRCCTDDVIKKQPNSEFLSVIADNDYKVRVTFWSADSMSSADLIPTSFNSNWKSSILLCEFPSQAITYAISVAKDDDTAIAATECNGITITEYTNNPKYTNKIISILGDSISTFAGDNPSSATDNHLIADGTYTYVGNHCRYPNTAVSNVHDTYWEKLIKKLNMRLGINDSWAGSLVTWDGTTESGDSGADIYIASTTRIGHLGENGYPDIILINAGTNDIGAGVTLGTFNTDSPRNYTQSVIDALPVATFADAYRTMLIRVQHMYPLARVIVMLPDYTTSYYNPDIADNYIEIIKDICDYFGVPYIDMRTSGINIYNTGTYLSDGIHPNIDGMNLLYEKVLGFFNGNL